MRKIVLRRINWPGKTLAVILYAFLFYLSFGTGSVYALDPGKRLTQYMHTSWRTQDGSAASGMYTIVQTSDGFLWFLSSRGDIYRFDGVQFRPWHLPAEEASMGRIRNIVGDKASGLWAHGATGIAYLKGGNVIAHFELEGLMPNASNLSQDADGSLWWCGATHSVGPGPGECTARCWWQPYPSNIQTGFPRLCSKLHTMWDTELGSRPEQAVHTLPSAESCSCGELGKNFVADSGEHRHQTGVRLVLRNEGIDHIQYVTGYLFVAGNHDDRSIRVNALYFQRDLVPIDLGHMIIDDHGCNFALSGNL
jgi:hypothetical protein